MLEQLEPRRLFAAGDPDPSFGDGGILHDNAPSNVRVHDSLVTPDGKIVIAGDVPDETGNSDYLLHRYNADGTPDNTFGGGDASATGRLGGAAALIRRMAPAPGGKIYAVGADATAARSFPFPGYIMRFNADGSLDTSFSDDGFDTVTLQQGEAVDLAVAADGGVFFIHEHDVVRYDSSGDIDTDFADNGVLQTDGNGVKALELDDGSLLVSFAIPLQQGGAEFILIKLDAGGSADTDFGDNGQINTEFVVLNMHELSGGKILIVGETAPVPNGVSHFAQRLNADGSTDTAFGENGKIGVLSSGSTTRTFIDEDGRIYLTSLIGQVARYSPDGVLDPTFGNVYYNNINGGFITFAAGITDDRVVFAGAEFGNDPDFILLGRLTEDDGNPSPVTFSSGTVAVAGTSGDDFIYIQDIPFVGAVVNNFGRIFDVDDVDLVSVTAGDGNDIIFSESAAHDTHLEGGSGRDRIAGGPADDIIEGNAQRDFLDGGDGDDLIVGNGGRDQIRGEAGDDSLGGGRGADYLEGNDGNDHLEGGVDSDIDILHGDDGTDSAKDDEDDIFDSIESVIP